MQACRFPRGRLPRCSKPGLIPDDNMHAARLTSGSLELALRRRRHFRRSDPHLGEASLPRSAVTNACGMVRDLARRRQLSPHGQHRRFYLPKCRSPGFRCADRENKSSGEGWDGHAQSVSGLKTRTQRRHLPGPAPRCFHGVKLPVRC